jgi:hypothetical protein
MVRVFEITHSLKEVSMKQGALILGLIALLPPLAEAREADPRDVEACMQNLRASQREFCEQREAECAAGSVCLNRILQEERAAEQREAEAAEAAKVEAYKRKCGLDYQRIHEFDLVGLPVARITECTGTELKLVSQIVSDGKIISTFEPEHGRISLYVIDGVIVGWDRWD